MKPGAVPRTIALALATALGAIQFASGCGSDERLRPESGVRAPKGTYTVTTGLSLNRSPERLDLLFVIENSPGMTDKRPMLTEAIPALVRRLVNPPCVSSTDPSDAKLERVVGPKERCPEGFERLSRPVKDVQVGRRVCAKFGRF